MSKLVGKTRIISILSVALLLLAAILAGCGGNRTSSSTPANAANGEAKAGKVRYAALGGLSGLAAKFGAEKGFFAEEGVDVEFVELSDQIAGLSSGDVDIADMPTTTAIIGASKGAPIKIVSSMFRTKGPFYLIGRPEIGSIEELAGRTVGIGRFGTGLEVYTRYILQKHGVSVDQVTFIANGTMQEAFASLESGQVAATIIHEPFVSLAEKTGKAKLLARGWDYLPTFHTGVLAARNGFIQEHPDLLEKMLRAYFKSQEYAKSHLDEYTEYVLRRMNIDRDVLEKAFRREEPIWENNPDVDMGAIEDTQRIHMEVGFQDQIYDLSNIIDLRFIPKK
jgi:NitT/TauT family transport system substrate-binding protein